MSTALATKRNWDTRTLIEADRSQPNAGPDLASRQQTVPQRTVTAAGMLGIALIHLLDLPGKLHETPYLGFGYIALIVASLVIANALLTRDATLVWLAAGGTALATLGGFCVDRIWGMPGAMGDIGNWLEPLGLASLFAEGIVIALCVRTLVRIGSRSH